MLLAVACCFQLTDVCRQLRMYAGLANQVEHLTSQMNTVEAEIDAAKASVKQLADKLNRLPLHRLSGEAGVAQGNSGGEP